jgi:hypothetical protein
MTGFLLSDMFVVTVPEAGTTTETAFVCQTFVGSLAVSVYVPAGVTLLMLYVPGPPVVTKGGLLGPVRVILIPLSFAPPTSAVTVPLAVAAARLTPGVGCGTTSETGCRGGSWTVESSANSWSTDATAGWLPLTKH